VGFLAAAFQPGEQLDIRRRQARPENLDLVRLLFAERRRGGFRQPRGDADAEPTGDELEQRPAAGLVERIEPARELRGELRLPEGG
jgi:hypothetical protein